MNRKIKTSFLTLFESVAMGVRIRWTCAWLCFHVVRMLIPMRLVYWICGLAHGSSAQVDSSRVWASDQLCRIRNASWTFVTSS
jgi:hypothetical protein